MRIRKTFPQVYRFVHPKSGAPYFLVSARSAKWGMSERKTFATEKEAKDYALQIEESIKLNGAQPAVPKEIKLQADAYQSLVDCLAPFNRKPEEAVDYFVKYLGEQKLRQAKPFLRELVDAWENEKLTSRIKPLAKRSKTELRQYARFLRRTWGDQKADDVTRKLIEGALNKLPVNNRNTHRKYLRYIRMFFIWAKDNRHLTGHNPTDGIKIKSEDFEAEFYPVEKVKNLLRYIAENEKDLIGYYALLTFAGLRPSEGARVQWQDIHFESGEIYVRKGKRPSRRFTLQSPAKETLMAWMNHHRDNTPKDAPFVPQKNLSNREREVRKATLKGEWIQDGLRHGMATYYNALTHDAYEVCYATGDDLKTVKRHYMRAVAEKRCKEFWALTPAKVLADAPMQP
jgi:integrase